MDENEWNRFMLKNNLEIRPNQYNYYSRTRDFLKGDNKILINPAKPGFGKPLPTIISSLDHFDTFEKIVIITPHSQSRKEWVKELNKLSIFIGQFIEWCPKVETLKPLYGERYKKIKEDDKGRKHLEKWDNTNKCKSFTDKCYELLDKLTFPIENYYKNQGIDHPIYEDKDKLPKKLVNCLYSIINLGILIKKIIVVDYFMFFNPKPLEYKTGKFWNKILLIIDEGHYYPDRLKDFYSKEIPINRVIPQILKDDDILFCEEFKKNPKKKKLFINSLKLLSSIFENQIQNMKHKEKIEFTYQKLKNVYDSKFSINHQFSFEIFLYNLQYYSNNIYGEINEGDDLSPLTELLDFLQYIKEKENDIDFKSLLYLQIYKTIDPKLTYRCKCLDTSKMSQCLLEKPKKIIFLSGTIDEDFYERTSVLKFKTKICSKIETFSLKPRVKIVSCGNFVLKKRKKELKEQLPHLINVLKKMTKNGERVLLGVISKEVANSINFELLQEGLTTVLLFDDDREKRITKRNMFNETKSIVGLLNLRGSILSINLLDELKNPPKYVIVFGYPFPHYLDPEYVWETERLFKEHRERGNDESTSEKFAKERQIWLPVSRMLYQFLLRGARKLEDCPLLFLWGTQFSDKNICYKYLPDELKGEVIDGKKIDDVLNDEK